MNKKKLAKKVWYKSILRNINKREALNNAKEEFARLLELPEEVVTNSTKITIVENNNILIEGYKKIVDYYDDYIKIRTNNLDVIIDGVGLDIKEITDFDLIICGQVYSLNYKK